MRRLVILLSLALATPAIAAEPVASAPNPDAVAAADRVLDAIGYETMMSQMADKMSKQFEDETKRVFEEKIGASADPEMLRRVAAVQTEFLRSFISDPKLRKATALLYARHFTASELDQMAVLMREPVMKKWNDRMPVVMADFMPLISAELANRRDDFQAEIIAIISEYVPADEQAPTN